MLNPLVEKCMLKLGNFMAADDEYREAHVLTPNSIAAKIQLTRCFMIRKTAKSEALKAEIKDVGSDLSKQERAENSAEESS